MPRPRYPFLFFGARSSGLPEAWMHWELCLYWLRFRRGPSAGRRELLEKELQQQLAPRKPSFEWNGRWLALRIADERSGRYGLSPSHLREMERVLRTVGRRFGLAEVQSASVVGYADDDVWTGWSLDRADPTEPPSVAASPMPRAPSLEQTRAAELTALAELDQGRAEELAIATERELFPEAPPFSIHRAACAVLGRSRRQDALAALIDGFHCERHRGDRAAKAALTTSPHSGVVEALAAACRRWMEADDSRMAVCHAADVFAERGDPAAVPILLELADLAAPGGAHADSLTFRNLVGALAAFDATTSAARVRGYLDRCQGSDAEAEREYVVRAIARRAPPALAWDLLSPRVKDLSSRGGRVRTHCLFELARAAEELGRGDPRWFELALERFRDPSDPDRSYLIPLLADVRHARSAQLLLELAESGTLLPPAFLPRLAESRDPRAAPIIEAALPGGDGALKLGGAALLDWDEPRFRPAVRRAAQAAIARLNHPWNVEYVAPLLRRVADEGLARRLRAAARRKRVERRATPEQKRQRNAVAEALRRLAQGMARP